MAKNPADKARGQNEWLRDLCNVEDVALRMCVPIDLATMEPEVISCSTKDRAHDVFDYWRVVLSSEPQLPRYSGAGRTLSLLIRDKVSGGFLGVVALSDPPNHWTQLVQHLGWDQGEEGNALRLRSQHQVVMMRRCLPIYEFGQMVGGKMLALLATSRDVMRVLELRYSYQFLLFGIRTLHGKGSQYNRLNQRGIELINVDDTAHGFYAMELRKGVTEYLRGKKPAPGKAATFTLAEQVDYWRERWLAARLQSTGKPSLIVPDPERYRLSSMIKKKQALPVAPETEHTDDGDASED